MNSTHSKIIAKIEKFEQLCHVLEFHKHNKSMLIPILQQVQEIYKYLPEDVLNFIATSLDIPSAKVFGVATFYTHFTLKPKGKYIIKVCNGTACHVKDSLPILDKMRTVLALKEKQNTTEDMMFSIETVSCLGACGLAPVVVVNEQVYSCMSPEKAEKLLESIIRNECEVKQ